MKQILVSVILGALVTGAAIGSGTGPSAPPRPPKKGTSASASAMMDSAKYEMGKSVFSGKCQMSDNSKAMASQKSKLTALASKCGKDGTALPSLAGKLSAEQVDALDYYVSKRFGM